MLRLERATIVDPALVPHLSDADIGEHGLSPREVDVLHLIAAGLDTGDIAKRLFLGVNTVKTHTRKIFKKIGVRTRLQAAIWVWSRPSP